jgi:hypothetical protein
MPDENKRPRKCPGCGAPITVEQAASVGDIARERRSCRWCGWEQEHTEDERDE